MGSACCETTPILCTKQGRTHRRCGGSFSGRVSQARSVEILQCHAMAPHFVAGAGQAIDVRPS